MEMLPFSPALVVVEIRCPRAVLEAHFRADALGHCKPLLLGEMLAIARPYRDMNDGTRGLPRAGHRTQVIDHLPLARTVGIFREERGAQGTFADRLGLTVANGAAKPPSPDDSRDQVGPPSRSR